MGAASEKGLYHPQGNISKEGDGLPLGERSGGALPE